MSSQPNPASTFPAIIWHPSFNPSQGFNGVSIDSNQAFRPWLPSPQVSNTDSDKLSNLSLDDQSHPQSHPQHQPRPNQSTPQPASTSTSRTLQPQAYVAYPELTCLHCLGANPPGKLGYVVSYVPADASGKPLTNDEGWHKVERRDTQEEELPEGTRSPSAFQAAEIVGDKKYVPDGAEDDLVGDMVE
ncbi:hypothetical protein AYX13_05052 [Cryptococcus neoformans]|nr:hypothetical protein AYX13_05052 [Cryptococcus neoformans var. grubii]